MANWIARSTAGRLIAAQAEATAKQLGHDMQPWRLDGIRRLSARCNVCGDLAFIADDFSRPNLSGPALTFRCKTDPSLVRTSIRLHLG